MKLYKYSQVFIIGFLTNSVIHEVHFYNTSILFLTVAGLTLSILHKRHQRRKAMKDSDEAYAAMFPGK